jgi:hypothetical protein
MSQKLYNPKSNSPALYISCWLSQIPIKLLSHGAKILYGRLAQWSNAHGKVFRSCPQLSLEIGTSISAIERYIKELKDSGLIGTFHPQAGGLNHFEFYDHPWMHEQINNNLLYHTTTPSNLTVLNNNESYPPSNLTVPPVKSDGTPPSNLTDINKKEIKRNTTTTQPVLQDSKNHPELVVVTNDFSNPKPQPQGKPQLTRDEASSTDYLTDIYAAHPFVTNDILGLEDFLAASYWLIRNRGDMILNRRRAGIKSLVESGRFEGDEEWIKSRRREKNRKIGDAKQKAIEEKMRNSSAPKNIVGSISSPKCLNNILTRLTGDKNYKENKQKEEERLLRIKKQIQKDIEKPKKSKSFKRMMLPEELRAN